MEISDIMWQTMSHYFKELLEEKCKIYESDNKYNIRKYYEGIKLVGFAIYHDELGIRILDEVHHIGSNKMTSVSMWKWFKKDANKMRLSVLKLNKTMFEMYKKLGFEVINENETNFIMERG